MGMQNFNIVLVGGNIPVQNIELDDFRFRGRPLNAAVRIPVALEAEARGGKLTILPERFQAAVTEPLDPATDASNLVAMTQAFFEYVGPRSFTATGHNAQFTIEGTAARKDEVRRALIDMDRTAELIGRDLLGADVSVFLRLDQESVTRMSFITMGDDGDVVVDVNVNYERVDLGAAEAVTRFPQNLAAITAIADNLVTRLAGRVTS
ncbi:MAG: hypothetical protein JO045_08250 [Mycobacterium sp.]|nr:hypothetical protein [Mycobacterium sp.]